MSALPWKRNRQSLGVYFVQIGVFRSHADPWQWNPITESYDAPLRDRGAAVRSQVQAQVIEAPGSVTGHAVKWWTITFSRSC